MGGLMKWWKKDGTARLRRRESAPLQFFSKRRPSSDEVYRENLNRFNKFRENERIQRQSMGANDLAAYQSISNDPPSFSGESTTPTDQRPLQYRSNTCPSKSYRSQNVGAARNDNSHHSGHRTKKISVQFHLCESTEESDVNYEHRATRHSMPAIASNGRARGLRRGQTSIDSQTIREEEIEEFEGAHCMHSGSVNDDDQTSYRSPPMKFYKQNLNPFPSTSETSSLSTLCEVQPVRGKCPEKPKRLLLNSKQSRKLLTEAHFTGAYRNFEIQSPYYSDSSSVLSVVGKQTNRSIEVDSLNDDQSVPPNHYQVIVNKHGDEVEYALPCIDMPEYQRRNKLPNCLTSDDSILAGEVFNENPLEFERILNENFEMNSNTSVSIQEEIHTSHRSHRNNQQSGRVMVTDLDKSTDSTNTLNDVDMNGRSELQTNRISYFHQAMQQTTDIICMISDFNSAGKMEAKIEMPLHFEWGVFKSTNVTVRKYTDLPVDDSNCDFTLIAETAIIRDAEILRKIRHPTVITLMAIAFEPYRRLALIMEPTKYSLNHFLFVKNEQLDVKEVVTVVKKIADAIQYLHEFDICHSNISSHSILVGDSLTQVKLSSFELAVPYKIDIRSDNELKSKQKSKLPSIRQKLSPKVSLSSEQKIERYKLLSTAGTPRKNSPESNYSIPFLREISTKYFPYCTEYRRKLSIFNYQAPELLSQTEPFVFPTKHSDTYALTLLLWELLNQCIPFVIYDEAKLYELLKTNYPLKFLPIVEEERCQRFHDILERGLKREPDTRLELDKMIRKLAAIEAETGREYEKNQNPIKCCCLKMQSGKSTQRRSIQENTADDAIEKMTPDKSTSKLFSIITSPKPSPVTALSANSTEKTISPLNNVTNNTFYRSILDFNKLLSPRRDTNDDTYQRSSTLKKRKKITPSNHSKRNVKDLFGDEIASGEKSDELKNTIINGRNSGGSTSGRPSNEFNNALTKSAIYKELDYTNIEDKSMTEPTEKSVVNKIDQPFGPKEVNNEAQSNDLKLSNPNNSCYQFVIDDYELPQELIARNNKIRRCTWLSSDQVNSSMQYEQSSAKALGVQAKDDVSTLPTLNESSDSNKKLNVSIKIVHKQLTPGKHVIENESLTPGNRIQPSDSMKSDCSSVSAVSATSSENSFSVKSRIKFFRSLESQPVQKRTPNKSKMNFSRRSEMSFNEAKKAIEKAQRHTFPSSNQPEHLNQQLIKEITEITADIKNCLSKNKYLQDKIDDHAEVANEKHLNYLLKADINEADESVAMLIDDLLNQKNLLDENEKNESCNEDAEKRNSVRETVQKFESSLRNEKNDKSFSIQKIENKLLNEKIFNTDLKHDTNKRTVFYGNRNDEVTDEKVEDVIHIVAPSEAENEDVPQMSLDANEPTTVADADNQQSQTLIKRTFYQESIISGTNVDMPELNTLLVNSPNVTASYATTRKSSFTTRVTLNMRKCRRRSSDVGQIGQQKLPNELPNEAFDSPRMTDVRHSICGNPLPMFSRNNSVEATSGRMFEQISGERFTNHASGLMVSNDQLQTSVSSVLTGIFNGKQIQSIEDLYIDDDFGGYGLAANMKLMTNSTDSLDNINFDLISTHIFEQTSESMMTNSTNINTNLNAIEQGENNATNEKSN